MDILPETPIVEIINPTGTDPGDQQLVDARLKEIPLMDLCDNQLRLAYIREHVIPNTKTLILSSVQSVNRRGVHVRKYNGAILAHYTSWHKMLDETPAPRHDTMHVQVLCSKRGEGASGRDLMIEAERVAYVQGMSRIAVYAAFERLIVYYKKMGFSGGENKSPGHGFYTPREVPNKGFLMSKHIGNTTVDLDSDMECHETFEDLTTERGECPTTMTQTQFTDHVLNHETEIITDSCSDQLNLRFVYNDTTVRLQFQRDPESLGKGTSCTVYQSTDRLCQLTVTVRDCPKMSRGDILAESFLERRLRHSPYVIRQRHLEGTKKFLVEPMDGHLYRLVSDRNMLTHQRLEIAEQVRRALVGLMNDGHYFTDLKDANVMYRMAGTTIEVRLVDIGSMTVDHTMEMVSTYPAPEASPLTGYIPSTIVISPYRMVDIMSYQFGVFLAGLIHGREHIHYLGFGDQFGTHNAAAVRAQYPRYMATDPNKRVDSAGLPIIYSPVGTSTAPPVRAAIESPRKTKRVRKA